MKPTLLTGLFCVVTLAALSTAVARPWTRASDGKSIEGDYVKMKDDATVVIRISGGQTRELPLVALSDADQAFVKEQSAPPAESAPDQGDGSEITLAGVHLCCGGCKKGVESAISSMEDVSVDFQGDDIVVTSKSSRDTQKAIDAIAAAGYYGTSNHTDVKIADAEAGDKEEESVTVSGVHLCCGKCVSAIDDVVKELGAEGHTAEKGSDSFEITGKVKPSAVLAALRAAGMNGTVK